MRIIALTTLALGPAAAAPPVVADRYTAALELLDAGHLADALPHLQAVLAANPGHAGALLDLALARCGLGQTARGLALLDQLEADFSPPPALHQLIRRFRDTLCQPAPPPSRRIIWSVAAGHSSNINQASSATTVRLGSGTATLDLQLDPQYRPRSGALYGADLDIRQGIPGHSALEGSLYLSALSYPGNERYNTLLLRGTLGHRQPLGGGLLESRLIASHLTLGGQTYQLGLGLQGEWQSQHLAGSQLGLRIDHFHYPQDHRYDARWTEAWLGKTWQAATALRLQGRLGWLIDQAVAKRPGGDRSGPVLQLGLEAEPFAGQHIEWLMRAAVQPDASPYNPQLFGPLHRKAHSTQQVIAWQQALDQGSALRLEWRQQRLEDKPSLFSYKSQTIFIYWLNSIN